MRVAFVLVASAAFAASTAVAALPPLQERIDLDEAAAIRVQLTSPFAVWVSVSDVGDVDGDGRGDVGVRTVQAHGGDARRSYVLFGGGGPRTVTAARLRSHGFEIARGPAVAGAGDLDRDGRGDLIIGDCLAGSLAVVYGRRTRGMLELGTSGQAGYAITGLGRLCPEARPGGAHNTRRHLLVGNCDPAKGGLGRAFLLPPRARGASSVDAPGAAILSITGRSVVCPIGLADVTGDGRDDVVVRDGTRSIYVVFDARRRASVDLGSLGRRGFRITTPRELFAASLAGDVNGDGRTDLVLGDRRQTSAYVVFGKSTATTVDVAELGAAGLTIRGEPNTNFPFAASAAGDVNGDGRSDVLLGAPGAGSEGDGVDRGAVYLVYGRRAGGELDLATSGPAFVRIDGERRGSAWGAGGSVASVADMDGDRRRELAIAGGYTGVAHVLLSTRLPR